MSKSAVISIGRSFKERVGALADSHPVQFIFYCAGVLWVVILLTVLLLQTQEIRVTTDSTRQALCGGQFKAAEDARAMNCRLLLDRMLKYATPEQIQQIKDMIDDR